MGGQLRVEGYELQLPSRRSQVAGPGSQVSNQKGGDADGERLRTACQEFESLLLEQIMKGLRRTVPEGESRQEALYRSLLDEQVARLCARRGLGLAALLFSRLEETGRQTDSSPESGLKVSEKTPIRDTTGIAPSGRRGPLGAPMQQAEGDIGVGGRE